MNKIYMKSSQKMKEVKDNSVNMVVTSPPYNINISYGNKTKNGKVIETKGKKYQDNLTETAYRNLLTEVFSECKRVLTEDGSLFINIKNRYNKDEMVPPFWITDVVEGMYLKNIIIWNFDWGGSTSKRFCPRYEYVFWFAKDKKKYKFNLEDVKIPTLNYRPDRYKSHLKNPSDVWRISMVSGNFSERTSHPAQFPERLIERIALASTDIGDTILDPFLGSGTTAVVAKKTLRKYIGYEIEKEYIEIAEKRLQNCKEGELLNESD